MKFSLNQLYLSCVITLFGVSSGYAQEVEFDELFLGMAAGQPTADLSKYSLGNPIPTGKYQADVYVNGTKRGAVYLKVEENEQDPIQGICLTPDLVEVLGLKGEAFKLSSNDQCVNIVKAIPDAKIQFDMGMLALNLEIPQIFVQNRPRGYVSPSLWQASSPTFFIRYYASHSQNRFQNYRSKQDYLSFRSGINLGEWSLRHQGAKSWFNHKSRPYQYQHTYLERDIDRLNGRVTFGDFATSGHFFGNFNLRGVQLASDERMLPASQRGYAPVIEGVALSNARVVVRQNERIIYETTVPAGAFRLDDIYPSGYSGELDVEIIEADGQVRILRVPFTNAVRLLRKGQFRYKLAVGKLRQGTRVFPEFISQVEMQYGVRNGLTLNLGANGSRGYVSGLFGLAFDTPVGAFSSDVVYTRYQFPHLKQRQAKYAMNIGYNARVPMLNSYISAVYYRSFSPENYSLQQVLAANRERGLLPVSHSLQKRISLSVSQPLGKKWGSLNISASRQQYWQAEPSYEYQMSYGNSYKNLHYQFGYGVNKRGGRASVDKRLFINVSLQFGGGANSPILHSRYQNANHHYHHTALTGTLGQDNQLSYSLSTHQQPHQRYYSANLGYKASAANVSLGVAKAKQYQQFNVNLSGALVAHSKGITFANDLGETFAIIHARGAAGAKVNNSSGSYLDWFGNGVVPYVSPYQINYVGIDPTPVADEVEVEATGQEIIPRANSSVLVEFKTKSGNMALFDVNLANGDVPPLAAEVFDQQDNHIGYVVQGGRVFVRGIADRGTLKVIWGSRDSEQCQFSYQLNGEPHKAIAVQCQ